VKAYFRRGSAYLQDFKLDEAQNDFKKALELDPQNKEAAKELAQIIQKKKL